MKLKKIGILFLFFAHFISAFSQANNKPPLSEKDQQFIRDWKNVNQPRYYKLHKKGTALVIGGVCIAALGIGLTTGGALTYQRPSTVTSANPGSINMGTNSLEHMMLLTGPLVIVGGGFMTVLGGIKLSRAHAIKQKAKKLDIELTYAPIISPLNKTYGTAVAINF